MVCVSVVVVVVDYVVLIAVGVVDFPPLAPDNPCRRHVWLSVPDAFVLPIPSCSPLIFSLVLLFCLSPSSSLPHSSPFLSSPPVFLTFPLSLSVFPCFLPRHCPCMSGVLSCTPQPPCVALSPSMLPFLSFPVFF